MLNRARMEVEMYVVAVMAAAALSLRRSSRVRVKGNDPKLALQRMGAGARVCEAVSPRVGDVGQRYDSPSDAR